jgi:hypothetical protein
MKPLVLLSVLVLSVPRFSLLAFGTEMPTFSVVLELFSIHEGFLAPPVQFRVTDNRLVVRSSRSARLISIPSPISQLPFLPHFFAVKHPSFHCGMNTYASYMYHESMLGLMASLGHVSSSYSGFVYGNNVCGGSYANSPPDSIAFHVIATPTK